MAQCHCARWLTSLCLRSWQRNLLVILSHQNQSKSTLPPAEESKDEHLILYKKPGKCEPQALGLQLASYAAMPQPLNPERGGVSGEALLGTSCTNIVSTQ